MCYWIWLDLMIWFFLCVFIFSWWVLSENTDNGPLSLLLVWYLILWGTGPDCLLRGTASYSCLFCVSLLPDKPLFVSHIDWPHTPSFHESERLQLQKGRRKAVLRVECNYYFFLLHSLIDVKHPTQFTSDAERKQINDHRFSATAAICIHYSAS